MEGGLAYKPVDEGPVGSFGKPPEGLLAMDVVDYDGNSVPPGELGELITRPAGRDAVLEYFKNPEASARKLRGGWTGGGHVDWRQLVGQGKDLRVFDDEVVAVNGLWTTLPELPDDLDRLNQHCLPELDRRPSIAEDVLVEILAGADAKKKSSRHHRGGRSCRLRDDRWMNPENRASDTGTEPKPRRRMGNAADRSPNKGGMALPANPRVEVIRNERIRESGLFGLDGKIDQRVWWKLFA